MSNVGDQLLASPNIETTLGELLVLAEWGLH